MTTIRDVAKRAAVAPITVSRVINNSGNVRSETRERVEQAIAELGYVPNSLARSLRSNHTHTLALVLTDITNPFWTTVARGVEDAASDAGYNLILCNTDESEAEQASYLAVLLQKQVDGILLVPAGSDVGDIRLMRRHGTPAVVLDRRVADVGTDIVRCDSEGGAYRLTRLLLDLGHRRIVMLSGPRGLSTAEDRVVGYRRALAEWGETCEDGLITYGEFTQTSGYDRMQQALCRTPHPTALFAANNFIAIGALCALRDAGLRVPEDVAVVASDDLPSGLVIDPFLTVAAQPAYEMGTRATELLLSRMAHGSQERQEIVLPVEVLVRASSGAGCEPHPSRVS